MKLEQSNFFIKYGDDENAEVDLINLSESICGLDELIKEIFLVSKINGTISVKATKLSNGSIDIDLIIKIVSSIDIFSNLQHLYNFLLASGYDVLCQKIQSFFGSFNILELNKNLNDFAKEYPADYDLIKSAFFGFIGYMIGISKKQKNSTPLLDDTNNNIPKEYALGARKILRKGYFKKILKPIIENNVPSIQFSPEKDFKKSNVINKENFESYLCEEDIILSEYESGKTYTIAGKITCLQSTRGDSLTFQIKKQKITYNLIALPQDDKTTENYAMFYGKNVFLDAEIIRDSNYKKPKLKIINIKLQSEPLDLFKKD